MKLYLSIFLVLFIQLTSYSQELTDTSAVLHFAEQMPEFNGNLKMFIPTQLNSDTNGRVVVKFMVDTVGEISHLSIAKQLTPKLDSEAISIIKQLPPSWIPGTQNGKKVAVWTMLPVDFYKRVTYTEKMPELPIDFNSFLKKNLKYPSAARKKHIEGRVVVKFVIDSTGAVKDPRIARSVDSSLDQEALRLINMLPRWRPGEQNGHKVAVYFTMPIIFKEDNY